MLTPRLLIPVTQSKNPGKYAAANVKFRVHHTTNPVSKGTSTGCIGLCALNSIEPYEGTSGIGFNAVNYLT